MWGHTNSDLILRRHAPVSPSILSSGQYNYNYNDNNFNSSELRTFNAKPTSLTLLPPLLFLPLLKNLYVPTYQIKIVAYYMHNFHIYNHKIIITHSQNTITINKPHKHSHSHNYNIHKTLINTTLMIKIGSGTPTC